MAKCIECGSSIDLPEGTVENEILDCESCDVELEVVSLDPPTVEPVSYTHLTLPTKA